MSSFADIFVYFFKIHLFFFVNQATNLNKFTMICTETSGYFFQIKIRKIIKFALHAFFVSCALVFWIQSTLFFSFYALIVLDFVSIEKKDSFSTFQWVLKNFPNIWTMKNKTILQFHYCLPRSAKRNLWSFTTYG